MNCKIKKALIDCSMKTLALAESELIEERDYIGLVIKGDKLSHKRLNEHKVNLCKQILRHKKLEKMINS